MSAPFAWFRYQQGSRVYYDTKKWDDCQPLYTHSVSGYERGFIDGMQKQMQSSVDKAVNRMAQTERPADCERCNRLEEQAYDLVGKLRVANIKLSMQPQRTWVGLTDEDEIDWEEGSSLKDLVKAIESKLREKNESREWQDLTDDEMLMIYGQKHEGKKYNLGRMVQQALKEKNNV